MKNWFDPEEGVPGVRLAMPADEDQIFELLLLLHAENGMFGVNPFKVREGIKWATRRKGGIIWVVNEGALIVASLGMLISTDWYSDDEYLLERWNYVHPRYRKSDHARKLLEQAKWTSEWFSRESKKKGRGPVPFQCGINSFDRTEGKVRLYARHMPCIGAFFMFGELPIPRQNDKMQDAVREVEEQYNRSTERPRKNVPLVETVLRVGQREGDHVRQQR